MSLMIVAMRFAFIGSDGRHRTRDWCWLRSRRLATDVASKMAPGANRENQKRHGGTPCYALSVYSASKNFVTQKPSPLGG